MLGPFGHGRFPAIKRDRRPAVSRWTAGSGACCDNPPMRFAVVLVSAALALGACASRGSVQPSQAAVNAKAVGLSVGDFFERYGRPLSRLERSDGTLVFDWAGGDTRVAAGPYGPEEKICRLLITTDTKGRIVSAEITRDAIGERSLSRCVEVLDR